MGVTTKNVITYTLCAIGVILAMAGATWFLREGQFHPLSNYSQPEILTQGPIAPGDIVQVAIRKCNESDNNVSILRVVQAKERNGSTIGVTSVGGALVILEPGCNDVVTNFLVSQVTPPGTYRFNVLDLAFGEGVQGRSWSTEEFTVEAR